MLKKIYEPKMDEVTVGRRKLRNEKLQNLYFSPNVDEMIKSRKTRHAGTVGRMG
jgi:hypothetical protein